MPDPTVRKLTPIVTPDLKLSPEARGDVSMFITCWTLEFMWMAVALGLTDEEVGKIAYAGEFLKPCLGFTMVLKGGRRRQRGGDDDDVQIATALTTTQGKLPAAARALMTEEKMTLVKTKLVEAREKALSKFTEGPTMASRLVRLLAITLVALGPVTDKLLTLAIKVKSKQIELAATTAFYTSPVQVALMAGSDAALTAVSGAKAATAAAGQEIAGMYDWVSSTIELFNNRPKTRGAAEKAAAEKAERDLQTLQAWANTDARLAELVEYEKKYNSTADILSQQPPSAIQTGTDAERGKFETEGWQIVKDIREKRATTYSILKVVAGFKNFLSEKEVYIALFGPLFRQHTMTYIKWSNMLAATIAGIVAEDPVAVVLCLTWVMSAVVGVSYVVRLLDALTTQLEVATVVKVQESSPDALLLKQMQEELKQMQKELKQRGPQLRDLIADASSNAAAPATAGRRLTSRRRHHRSSLPRRTRRSSFGRLRGSSRHRRE